MKKLLKWGGIVVLVIVAALFVVRLTAHKPLPEGTEGPKADSLASCMLQAINDSAWEETGAVAWTFPGGHHYLWDRDRHWVRVEWGKHMVLLEIDSKTGIVWKNGAEITHDPKQQKLLEKAWQFWVNDSFWLNAPSKVFDPGTKRYWVEQEQGKPSLLVTYTQGGNTPGDSYLWHLDQDNLPVSWQLWVRIIPVGGISFSWEDWKRLSTGAMIATAHKSSFLTLELKNIKGAKFVEMLNDGKDPFSPLMNK